MANEELQNEEEVVESQEGKENESLIKLLKEATELSRVGALVNLAYARAKTADKAKEGYHKVASIADAKIKATVGAVKENSKLYDEIKAKKAGLEDYFTKIINAIADKYDIEIENLLAEKAQLENENIALAADSRNLKLDQREAKSQYRKNEKSQKSVDVNREIAAKKAEAEKLAREGNLEGAQAALEEYKKLKGAQVQETADGMLGVAEISSKLKANREKFEANKARIEEIEKQIEKLDLRREELIERACDIEEKELAKIDGKTSVFKKLAMFASKTVTRVFNKGKAINDEVFEPLKNKIEQKVPEIKQSIETKITEIKDNTKQSFKEKLDKAMEFGRGVRQGAIDKLKARNDKKRETQKNRQEYLNKRKEEENEK